MKLDLVVQLLGLSMIRLSYGTEEDYEVLIDHLTTRIGKSLGLVPIRTPITPNIPKHYDDVQRMKRKSNPEACLIDCAASMTKKVREMATHDFGFVNSELLEEGHLEQFCSLYMMGKKCIDTCPDSPAKDNLMATFRPLNYICVEHHKELLTHLTCYRESQIEIERRCASKCAKTNIPINDLQYYQAMGRNLNEIVQALDDLCSRLECELECQEPIIRSICLNDTSAAAYMKNFARESILPMEAIMRKSSTLRHWPDNCQRITQGLGEDSKQRRKPVYQQRQSDSNPYTQNTQSGSRERPPQHQSQSQPKPKEDGNSPSQRDTQESVGLPHSSAAASPLSLSLFVLLLPLSFFFLILPKWT